MTPSVNDFTHGNAGLSSAARWIEQLLLGSLGTAIAAALYALARSSGDTAVAITAPPAPPSPTPPPRASQSPYDTYARASVPSPTN